MVGRIGAVVAIGLGGVLLGAALGAGLGTAARPALRRALKAGLKAAQAARETGAELVELAEDAYAEARADLAREAETVPDDDAPSAAGENVAAVAEPVPAGGGSPHAR